MKIAIVINGTRGDVQPMLALSLGLIKKGHQIIFCAPPENEELVKRYNCDFVAFGPNYKELFKKNAQMKGGATKAPSPGEMKQEIANQIRFLPELLHGADIVLGTGFVIGVHSVADILKVPYRFVIFYPILLGTTRKDPLLNRMLFGFGRLMTNMVMKGFINKKRLSFGLEPVRDVWSHWMGENVIVACDKQLNPAREGLDFNFIQTGFMLQETRQGLPENVTRFLNSGKPPFYIGFGSNPVARPEKFREMFKVISKSTHQRLIVSKGWAELPEENTSEILYVDEIPFELLFPYMSAVVYHGGTGTMACAARAGVPQIAFPFMADQFENRKRIVQLGLGPKVCDFRKISDSAIISAINECLANDSYKKNSLEIAKRLNNSNGLEKTINVVEETVGQF